MANRKRRDAIGSDKAVSHADPVDPRLFEADRLYLRGRSAATIKQIDEWLPTAEGRDRVGLQLIQAMARYDQGDIRQGLEELKTVETLARGFDLAFQFRAAASLFNRVSEYESPADALPFLSRLRQITAANGNALSLAGLHLAVAKMEACRGNGLGATAQVETARRFAARTDPTPLLASIELIDISLSILTGNIVRASSRARRAYEHAAISSNSVQMAGAAGLIGLLALIKGKINSAHRFMDQAIELAEEISSMKLGIIDNMAQVALFEGDLDKCSRYLDECAQVIASQDVPARSWYDFAHQVTRCSALEQFGDWEGIIDIAREADGELERRQFRSLRTALLCASARANARLGDHTKAERLLSTATRVCPRGAVDPQIVLEASTASCLTLRGDYSRGSAHFERALAAAKAIGHRLHEHNILREQESCRQVESTPPRTDTQPLSERAIVLSDAATILCAGSSIDLISHLVWSLLQGTSLGSRMSMQSFSGEKFRPEPSATMTTNADGSVEIDLRGSDRRVVMTIDRIEGLDDVSLLRSLNDLLQASAQRAVDGQGATDDQNLWPTTLLPDADEMVFRSPRMAEVVRVALRLASTELPILITGETGTGKDVIARLIHNHSHVRRGPYIPFNCSSIPKELTESQLFGHRRGAFTGAVDGSPGVIRSAAGGTLFLDEIGDLEAALQPKLLRFLESGEIHTVGEPRPTKVNVRIVAATNADLEALSKTGAFRRDLYFRIGTAAIHLPPLRERKDEIPALAAAFIAKYSRECDRPGLRMSDDLMAALLMHDWPGNIRQLANELRRIVAISEPGQILTSADLSAAVTQDWKLAHTLSQVSGHALVVSLDQPLPRAVEELERAFIDRAMRSSGGRVSEAAQLLGISRKGLFLKRRRIGHDDVYDEPSDVSQG